MKEVLDKQKGFFVPYWAFLLIGGFLLSLTKKEALHLTLNKFHHPILDVFFKYVTYLGDGLTALIVCIILLMVSYRYLLVIGLSVLSSSLDAQILKRFVFEDSVRPAKFFEGISKLHLIEGITQHSFHSFPSGHSTTAFALFTGIALLSKKNSYKVTCLLLAVTIAYSRVYLSQHFFEDIYAGAILGSFTAILFYYLFKANNNPKLDKNLLSSLKKQ